MMHTARSWSALVLPLSRGSRVALVPVVALASLASCVNRIGDDPLASRAEAASAEAVTYTFAGGGDRSLHIVDVDLCEPDIELRATGPADGTRTVSSFAARTNAIVAINGGHSWGGDPGPSAHDGAFFGLPDAGDLGQAIFSDGVARFVHMYEEYAPSAGDDEVMTGLLTLVHDGVAQHDILPNDEYTCAAQHPRTLIGLTEDRRRAILVVVDGRAPSQGRRGMTCGEAADLMVFLGAHWALNLDGGGSSEMVVNGDIVNVPSDGHERPVPTHLAVVRTPGARGHCPDDPRAPPPSDPPPSDPPPSDPPSDPPPSDPPSDPPPSDPPANPAPCGLLASGAVLLPDQVLASCDGRFAFLLQSDGNVVLYQDGTALWNSGTNGLPGGALVLQTDGNLVLYGPAWSVLWQSHTAGHDGAALAVQDDGNVVLYGPAGPAWQTGTCCR
jgi:hypothetical protein